MGPIIALWLPILLSAVIVFIASSIIHMVLPYHRSNYKKLPDEDNIRKSLRALNLTPGLVTHHDLVRRGELGVSSDPGHVVAIQIS